MEHTDTVRSVAEILTQRGYAASAEYPGLVLFTDRNGFRWATGLNGWDYATGAKALPIDVDADETDPEPIAAAIRAAIDGTACLCVWTGSETYSDECPTHREG